MSGDGRVRLTALISGKVQGVGFRAFTRVQAQTLDLAGHVENLDDGRVEVVVEGWRDDIELLLVRLRNGPSHAEVEAIEETWAAPVGLVGFHVY